MKNHDTYSSPNPAVRAHNLSMFGMTEATMRRSMRETGSWSRYALSMLYSAAADLVRAEPETDTQRQRLNRAKFAMVTFEEQDGIDAGPYLGRLSDAQKLIGLGRTAHAEELIVDVALAYRRALAE